MERMYDLKKKVKGALIYPAIILVAIIGIGIVMMIYVVPTLAATFEQSHAQLPFTTQVVIDMSNFLSQYTFLAISGMIGFVVLVYAIARTTSGSRAFDFIFLHTPVIGNLVREVNAARTARTLASLLSSGVDVLTSLSIVREVLQNSYFKEVIDEAQKEVGAGQELSVVFARREDLYPPFVGEMMAVGAETGATNEMLKRIATYYEDNVDRSTKDMSTIIEPFLMIIIGCAVGFFAISMITPIYQLSSNIS
jgi:type IV pilus assembly protein PilC